MFLLSILLLKVLTHSSSFRVFIVHFIFRLLRCLSICGLVFVKLQHIHFRLATFSCLHQSSGSWSWPVMGNRPAKPERDEVLLKIVPPLDQAYVRWLARDLERIHGFTPRNPRAVRPPDHYIEYMRLQGWLDVSLDDPDLAHLLK